ncbi:hypothetical protein LMUR_12974 [Listeria grayi FSL F6-1183]|uniref:Uncharacterized protein n=1 Tax=Listeria grayi FSL F6-1183 TaxID=1265827 RepID=A0A829R366_LISGR|nr:hypothetical protein LMUR_12974 [Listeria grayi FSL F6-1183]
MTEITPWTNKRKSLNQIDYLNANNFRDLRTNIEYKLQHKKRKKSLSLLLLIKEKGKVIAP